MFGLVPNQIAIRDTNIPEYNPAITSSIIIPNPLGKRSTALHGHGLKMSANLKSTKAII
jgi:hypothetical protein